MINKVTFLLLTLTLSMVSIHAQGTIGIGVSTPDEKLRVIGSIQGDTTITATKIYADSVVVYRDATVNYPCTHLSYPSHGSHEEFYKDKLIYTVVDGKLKLTKKLVATKAKREIVAKETYIKYQ